MARWYVIFLMVALFAIIQTSGARNVPTEDKHGGLNDQKNFINFGGSTGNGGGGGGDPGSGGLPGIGGGLPDFGGDHGESGSGIFPGFGGSGGSNNIGDFFGSFPHP